MKNSIKSKLKEVVFLKTVDKWILEFKRKIRKPIIGKNNLINLKGDLTNVKFDIIGNDNFVEILSGSLISNFTVFIRGNNHRLVINENCIIRGGEAWFEDENCKIEIGKNSTIESAHLAVTETNSMITIRDDCMFSNQIELRTGDSHSIINLEDGKRINFAKDIHIGDHVWIGSRLIILKGVTIGNNSIIGTNALVTKSIPSNSVSVGIPAKVLKNNVDWLRERIYC